MVPTGDDAQSKVPGDDAVHRYHQRGGQGGKKQVAADVVAPLFVGAGPAQRQPGENFLAQAGGAVADARQVRQHAGVPEQAADRQIGADSHHV